MKFDVHTGEAVAGGEDALAPPKYWDDVKDPTVAQYFHITSKTHADEYERVLGAFMLTLDPSAFTIHSVHRVQNLSLWKTYAAKRAATCSREDDPEKARRRFVRAWLFHGCLSVWKSNSASGAHGVEVDAMIQHEGAVNFGLQVLVEPGSEDPAAGLQPLLLREAREFLWQEPV